MGNSIPVAKHPRTSPERTKALNIRAKLKYNIEVGLLRKIGEKSVVDYRYGNVPDRKKEWFVITTPIFFPNADHGLSEMTPDDIDDFIQHREPHNDLVRQLKALTDEVSQVCVTNLHITFENDREYIRFDVKYDVYIPDALPYRDRLKRCDVLEIGVPEKTPYVSPFSLVTV